MGPNVIGIVVQDQNKTRNELIAELQELRSRLTTSRPALRDAVQIINNSPAVVFLWRNEAGWPVELVSENVERVFGYTSADFTSGRIAYGDIVHPDDLGRIEREVAELSADPSVTNFAHDAYRITTKTGETRWLDDRTTVVRDAAGRITHYQGIVLDTTDRKSAEKQLRRSREKYRRVYETAPLAFVVWDRDCLITEWNERAEVLFGWSRQEVLGKNFFEFLIPEAERPSVADVVDALMHGDLPSHSVNTNLTKAGSSVTCEWNNARMRNDRDEVTGAISLALDITERVRAEEERRRLEQQVSRAQKLESLSVLAGGIAHDFSNLLVAILGNAELALLDVPAPSPARSKIRRIERAASRAADLARQMLAYSGKGQFLVEPLDLSAVVEDITHLLEVSMSKRAKLRLQLAPDLPMVEADATQLRQILMNLITNASEAIGDRDGMITVSTGVMHYSREELRGTYLDDNLPGGRYCYLEVDDSGGGMGDTVRSRIFEPFFSTKFIGRGLGLAGVLGIVRGHGGAIEVHSDTGSGTTFKILLPVTETPAPARPPSPVRDETWSGTGTALLVDDEEMVREVARGMLERLGFDIVEAHDGDQAVGIFRRTPDKFAFVLLDLTMPGLGSEECCRQIRAANDTVPIILSSGYSEQELATRFAASDFSGFVQKPYNLDSLVETLRAALPLP